MDETWSVGPPPVRSSRRGAVLVVLAVIAGFVGGLTAGYAIDDEPAVDEVDALGAGVGSSDTDAATSSASEQSSSTPGTTFVGSGSDLAMGPAPRERLFRRTAAGGFSVRAFARDYGRPAPEDCAEGRWCPPPQCFPTKGIEVDVVSEWTVTGGGGPDFPVRDGQPARLIGTIVNWNGQDEPIFGAVVRTADGARAVRLTSDGATDEMAPIDGIAVVVVPSSAVDSNGSVRFPADASLAVVDASGATSELALTSGGMPDPECMPPPPGPPALPAAGEQPADPAAQEAVVRERFAYVFGPENSAERLVEAVDDPTGLDELRTALKEGHPNEVGNVEYEVGELVFTSPDAASYVFRPVVSGRALPWQIGGARLIEGRWMITRATMCAMYQLGGVRC